MGTLLVELKDADVMSALDVLFRWVHVVAVVLWIGLAYFLNWVYVPFASELSPENKLLVQTKLLPRVLFFSRFAALYALAFGLILLFNLYYMTGDYFYRPLTEFAGSRPSILIWLQPFFGLLIGYGIYELIFKALGKRAPALAGVLWAAVAIGYAGYLIEILEASNRCALVHVAALLGSTMVANTWTNVWPQMSRMIQALEKGEEPSAPDLELARERGRHNVHMSVPALLLMLSVHISWLTGLQAWYLLLPIIFVLGFVATSLLFRKSIRLDEEHWSI